MRIAYKSLALAAFAALASTGCVSQEKYNALRIERDGLNERLAAAQQDTIAARTQAALVVPTAGSPRVSAAQLHAGRTGDQPEYARYEGCPPARPARSWIHRYPRRTCGGNH